MNWLGFQGVGVKVKVTAKSNIWVSYCSGRWHPRPRVGVKHHRVQPVWSLILWLLMGKFSRGTQRIRGLKVLTFYGLLFCMYMCLLCFLIYVYTYAFIFYFFNFYFAVLPMMYLNEMNEWIKSRPKIRDEGEELLHPLKNFLRKPITRRTAVSGDSMATWERTMSVVCLAAADRRRWTETRHQRTITYSLRKSTTYVESGPNVYISKAASKSNVKIIHLFAAEVSKNI